jgi:Fic family protein
MNKLLKKIQAKKRQLDKSLANKDNRKVLSDWLRTELAYTSNAIEGNTLSRRETKLAIDENITSGSKPIKDYQEARNHSAAYGMILDAMENNMPANEKLVLGIHKRILSGLDDAAAGSYRGVRVRISGSATILPNPLKVPELMDEFDKWLGTKKLDALHKAIEAHYRLVSIHPFIDGNGRTARLLMNYMLMKNGYAPIIIRPIDRKRYLNALEAYQTEGQGDKYLSFMLSAMSRSLSMVIDLLDKDKADAKKLLTIAKFAESAGLPVSTIRYWVSVGKLKPAAYTASGYMLFETGQVNGLKKLKV